MDLKKKLPKKGIIYLATIPPYMNVARIREFFEQYGTVGRIFLQPADTDSSSGSQRSVKKRNKKYAKHFTEGWVEFEKKSVAKKITAMLNNTQVSSRKNSKHYDCMWNIKYLSHFKWIHLNERLAYEKVVRKQKLQAEIAQAKKQANYFNLNVERSAKHKKTVLPNVIQRKKLNNPSKTEKVVNEVDRGTFLKNLFDS